MAKDVHYLTEFVETLENPILKENLDELQQTVNLLQNPEEYYDDTIRNKRYGQVDSANAKALLEKYDCEPLIGLEIPSCMLMKV